MTCSECIALLATADLGRLNLLTQGENKEPDDRRALTAHVDTCIECRRAVQLLIAGERALADSLAADVSTVDPTQLGARVIDALQRRRRRLMASLGAVAMVVLLLWTASTYVLPEARRLLSAPPPVVTKTFQTTCLTSNQAAALLQPYLPAPENPRWQAERFSVTPLSHGLSGVSVRAPQELVDRVPELLAGFERDFGRACR